MEATLPVTPRFSFIFGNQWIKKDENTQLSNKGILGLSLRKPNNDPNREMQNFFLAIRKMHNCQESMRRHEAIGVVKNPSLYCLKQWRDAKRGILTSWEVQCA